MDLNADEQLEQHQEHSSFQELQHLNIDLCLELIFPYLELDDLANAADTCKQMQSAAEDAFARNYGGNVFVVSERAYYGKNDFERDTTIYIGNRKRCFQVLRSFGHLISGLYLIYYEFTKPFWMELDKYVENYCANYISRLEILGRKCSFRNLPSTFPRVENVVLLSCELDGRITELNERFPKMRSLVLARDFFHWTKVCYEPSIVEHFPHLEHLSVFLADWHEKRHGLREHTVLSILRLNPSLRRLNLCSDHYLSEEFVRSVSEICESLNTLQITGRALNFHGKIHFKNVKMLTIQLHRGIFDTPIPLTFDALEIFKCRFLELEPFVFDFIRNNPTIVKLDLLFLDHVKHIFAFKNTAETKRLFASVKEVWLIISNNTFSSAKEITNFMDNCPSVQSLVLKAKDMLVYNKLKEFTKLLEHNMIFTTNEKERVFIYQRPIQNNLRRM